MKVNVVAWQVNFSRTFCRKGVMGPMDVPSISCCSLVKKFADALESAWLQHGLGLSSPFPTFSRRFAGK